MNTRLFNPMRPVLGALIVLASFTFQHCTKKDEAPAQDQQARQDDQLIQQYLQNNAIEASKNTSGFYYVPLVSSPDGPAVKQNDIVSLYYTVTLLNGNVVDSHTAAEGKAPVKFRASSQSLHPVGLDLGIGLMKKGEKYRFFLPSGLAYSNYTKSGVIDPNSVVIIDAEIINIETLEQQKAIEDQMIQQYIAEKELENVTQYPTGLYYYRTQEGTGSTPQNGQKVSVNYVGKYLNGTKFDESKAGTPYQFIINNSQTNARPIEGFEFGIKMMKKGEKGHLIIPSHLAYGASYQVIPMALREDIYKFYNQFAPLLPYSVIVFEVELSNIE